MVDLRLLNGLGNILFQYAYARIVAESRGYALRFRSDPGEGREGMVYDAPTVADAASYYPTLAALFDGFLALEGREITTDPLYVMTPNVLTAHDVRRAGDLIECDQRMDLADHQRVINHPGMIVIESWLQDYKLFRPYKRDVRRFYTPRLLGDMPDEEDAVMHIRLGDYPTCCNTLPLEYYQSMVQRFTDRNVVGVTDSPDHFYVEALNEEPNFSLYDGTGFRCDGIDDASRRVVADFLFMLNTRGPLILSNSSFCWWAAFLSHAELVLHPLMSQETRARISGEEAMTVDVRNRAEYDPYWILDETHPSQPDLFVDDETRWIRAVI